MKWLTTLPGDLLRAVILLTAFGSAFAAILGWVSYLAPKLVFASEIALPALAAAAVAGLIWLILPSPRKPASAGPLALVGVLLWGAMMAPEAGQRLVQRHATAGTETLKIVQFNLWRDDWSHTNEKAAWIEKQDPDLILMQEVGGGSQWLLARLAKRYPYRTGCENLRYSCQLVILSKQKPIEIGSSMAEDPKSNWAWARFSGPGGEFVAATTHAPWPLLNGVQQQTLGQLASDLARVKSSAVILTGDFNAAPWSPPIRKFDRDSGLQRRTLFQLSWPAPALGDARAPLPLPLLPIDHIFTSPSWRLVSLQRGPDIGSDHYPLVAVLTRETARPKTERAPPGKP
ncbi:MAG TPA: endonuclease/exonuclease/phosphatase family protein [Caulobacteraceae bacterium]|nr:endonuclease/exonuclease/phosphatase family protein [Caulobacteraceae bacterium]